MAIESRAHRPRDYDVGDSQTRDAERRRQRAQGVFDRIEGRPTLKISGPQGGPIETVSYDFSKLPTEKIRLIRTILAEAVVAIGRD